MSVILRPYQETVIASLMERMLREQVEANDE